MRRVAKTAPSTGGNIGAATPMVPAKTQHAAAASTASHRPKSRRLRRKAGRRRG